MEWVSSARASSSNTWRGCFGFGRISGTGRCTNCAPSTGTKVLSSAGASGGVEEPGTAEPTATGASSEACVGTRLRRHVCRAGVGGTDGLALCPGAVGRHRRISHRPALLRAVAGSVGASFAPMLVLLGFRRCGRDQRAQAAAQAAAAVLVAHGPNSGRSSARAGAHGPGRVLARTRGRPPPLSPPRRASCALLRRLLNRLLNRLLRRILGPMLRRILCRILCWILGLCTARLLG